MIALLAKGMLSEGYRKDPVEAGNCFNRTIELAGEFGTIANLYAAIAYAGLAEIEESEGNIAGAKRLRRNSRKLSGYDFIIELYPGNSH